MLAVVKRGKSLVETEVPDVVPAEGQVLVKTVLCGICGSDLHAVHHFDDMIAMGLRAGAADTVDLNRDLVMGHEFVAEVLDHGPRTTKRLRPGTRVVSPPWGLGPDGVELLGFSTRFPGGFGERMILTEPMLLEVPETLSDAQAALTEPLSVGSHAVNQADLQGRPVALVIGCGPVGLAVIAALKRRGIGPVIAVDFAPGRRALAEKLGADIVVDPALSSPHDHWAAFDVPATLADLGRMAGSDRQFRQPVIFECVGVPGLLHAIIEQGPPLAQIIVVGVCQESDMIVPGLAILKQLRLHFVYAYSAAEFADTLHDLADGKYAVGPMVSKIVGRSDVVQAFQDLAHPGDLVKILVAPDRPHVEGGAPHGFHDAGPVPTPA